MATSSYTFDVFLSFRGDIRFGFASHLYESLTRAGFNVFKDDERMIEGEVINEALKTAIDGSRICMPIFSTNYASSTACLRELCHMVQECKSIIPIFYNVGVDGVELKTDLYKKALEDHHEKGKVGKEEVEKWKMALIEVCKILGYNIVNKDEANEITKITREVVNRLMPRNQNVTNHFVEIDDQVESIIKMLNLNSSGYRIIGLYGMGGIGKTTLAKVVYNRISSHFNHCCTFIANVRESAQNNQLRELQQQLYKDLIDPKFAGSINDINCGINMIKKGLENKKFLLVLDDVDNEDLLTNFVGDHARLANGSRIIITTRDKRVLQLLEQDLEVYKVQELDDDRALQLFSKCAFKSDSSQEKFESLSKKVISSLGGLPLALEVVGSSLFNRNMKAWEETIEMLKEAPNERIQRSFMISYHRLRKDERNIFLDIACYPKRIEETRACYMWASCGWHPNVSLDNLINQSLVKVEVFRGVKWLWMHDVLKDFGRGMVRNDFDENGRTLKRFLQVDENFDKMSNEERKCVEMLQILTTGVGTISSADLQGFENVRFIELERDFIRGNFDGLFPNLRWISIRNLQHFTATNFHPKNLVVLELFAPYLQILDLQIKGNELKVLDFSYCEYMKQTPSFKELPSLEMLILDWCTDLTKIDNSIGGLKKLICLSMRECWSLQCLPEDIGDAEALVEIVLIGNNQRFELPLSIGNLKNLSQLQLIKLDMGKLPASIGKLESLSEMDLSYTSINDLPYTIGQLKELRKLRMNHSKIRKFPTTFERLVKLEELEAEGCKDFIYSDRLTWVFDVSKLKCLSKLELIGCSNVESIEGFDGLEYMEELCIRKLRRLSSLKLWNCRNLKSIVGFDGLESLIDLSIKGCSSVEDFSFLYLLTSLSSLELWNCRNLKKIEGFKGLESLINLSIRDCPSLENCPLFSILMRKLSSIELMDCNNLKGKLVFLGLESLGVLTLENLGINSLELLVCGKLESIEGLDGLDSLNNLSIEDCPSLGCLPDLSMLRNLRSLKLHNLEGLECIEGLTQLEFLKEVNITACQSLEQDAYDLYKQNNTKRGVLTDCNIPPYLSEVPIQCMFFASQDINHNDIVEINDEVEFVMKMLDLNFGGCRIIGLWGIGGIGKTTLAKVVFDRLSANFNNCCTFIANVRESMQNQQLLMLQQQLYKDLIGSTFVNSIDDSNNRINLIEKGLENKKFLLVLDDVDDENVLKNFVGDHSRLANGSRIIITTRNERVLNALKNDSVHQSSNDGALVKDFQVQQLDDNRALRLFSKWAFKKDSPPDEFKSLSEKVISSLGGLPLALEVIGSLLRGRKKEAWKDLIERLKKTPDNKIQTSLMISYHDLHEEEKKIFLDIACYPGSLEKTGSCYMWKSCGWQPDLSLDNLISKSLVKVESSTFWDKSKDERLRMHDVLKDLGRAIIREKCERKEREFEKFLQIGESGGSFGRIPNEEERKYVEMLQIDSPNGTITSNDLIGFENVRFLKLQASKIEGNFEGLFPNLRWITINDVELFEAANFNLENLIVLQLRYPSVEVIGLWWSQMKAHKLQVLEIVVDRSDWDDLMEERQIFKPSASVYNLENLSRLCLINVKMEELEDSIGNLVSLCELDLSGTCIKVLPNAIGQLKQLEILRINDGKITKFPPTIGNLMKLEELEATKCWDFEGDIPSEIGMLSCLRILDFRGTPIHRIQKLPSSLTHLLVDYREDDFYTCSEEKFLSSEDVEICSTSLLELINVLKLELRLCDSYVDGHGNRLDVRWIWRFHSRHLDFGRIWRLSMLENLYLCIPYVISGLESVNRLSQLKQLELWFAEFQDHLQLPSMLSSLALHDCKFRSGILDVSNVKKLRELNISNCDMREIRGLTEMDSLHDLRIRSLRNVSSLGLRSYKKLRNISLMDCPSLENFTVPSKVQSLSLMNLLNCKDLSKIDRFSGLEYLTFLSIEGLRINSLNLVACGNLSIIKGLNGLKSLTVLSIEDCPSLLYLPNLSNLVNLRSLTLRKLERLWCIEGLAQLEFLKEVNITGCHSLELDPDDLCKLNNTKSVLITDCDKLPRVCLPCFGKRHASYPCSSLAIQVTKMKKPKQ